MFVYTISLTRGIVKVCFPRLCTGTETSWYGDVLVQRRPGTETSVANVPSLCKPFHLTQSIWKKYLGSSR
jgi:hypothetical protein